MITRQKLKKTQGGMELIRRIAAEGDRVFSTERKGGHPILSLSRRKMNYEYLL